MNTTIQKRIDAGLCTRCCVAVDTGKQKCESCLEKERSYNKKYYKERGKKQPVKGECVNCSRKTDSIYKCCKTCRRRSRDRRRVFKEAGFCYGCGTHRTSNSPLCTVCYLKSRAIYLWGCSDRWQDLELLFENQMNRCPISGRVLTLGVDSSIDHISPKSKGGSNELSNLQWVHKMVQGLKLNHSKEDLFELARDICLWNKLLEPESV